MILPMADHGFPAFAEKAFGVFGLFPLPEQGDGFVEIGGWFCYTRGGFTYDIRIAIAIPVPAVTL